MTANPLGVVVVAFNSADVIGECLESLFASAGATLHVVVVDNRSDDDTLEMIGNWAAGRSYRRRPGAAPIAVGPAAKPVPIVTRVPDQPAADAGALTVIRSDVNGGFAYAVNLGLRALLPRAEIDAFWLLNPDCVVAPDTARLYLDEAVRAPFGLLACRTLYYEQPDIIQTDGGKIDRSATCRGINNGQPASATPLPGNNSLDYTSGANMVASRAFIERAGLMEEDYFLYYEEVDWAMKRGDLALRLVPTARVYHHGGTTIGSGSPTRRPQPFANYFNYRNRLRFARRHMPGRVPLAVLRALAKAVQLLVLRAPDEASAVLAGTFDWRPPAGVIARITDPAARARAFGAAR